MSARTTVSGWLRATVTWLRAGMTWRVGYLLAWILVGASAVSLYASTTGPSFYGLTIRAGISVEPLAKPQGPVGAEQPVGVEPKKATPSTGIGCIRVEGEVSVVDLPWTGTSVTVTAIGESGTLMVVERVKIDPMRDPGMFTTCVAGEAGKERLARIELSAAQPLAELSAQPATKWLADSAARECERHRLVDDARCHRIAGTETLTIQGANAVRHESTSVPLWALVLGVGTFVCGIYASILGTRRLGVLANAGASVAIVLLSLMMLGIIVEGYLYVLENHHDGGVVIQTSLGYLTRSTYHAQIPEDWIFSLTLPGRSAAGGPIQGFGAPLWVILLGTFGACLIAAQYLVRSPFDLGDRSEQGSTPVSQEQKNLLTGSKADQLVTILFAPLGSIYVYQSLMMFDTIGSVAVATTILASGVSVNLLVSMASAKVTASVNKALGRDEATRPNSVSP